MIKITFTIGIGKDKDGKAIPQEDQVLFSKRAKAMVTREFGGSSSHIVEGEWVSPKGEIVEERSLVISTTTDSPGNRYTAKELARGFRVLFNQDCVMVTREVVQMELI